MTTPNNNIPGRGPILMSMNTLGFDSSSDIVLLWNVLDCVLIGQQKPTFIGEKDLVVNLTTFKTEVRVRRRFAAVLNEFNVVPVFERGF